MFKKIWISLFLAFSIYTALVYTQCDAGTTGSQPDDLDKSITAGRDIWQKYNCQSCHQLYGLGGYLGPELTNTASIKGAKYMSTIIKYGTGRMPNFHLTDSEVENLVHYLSWIDNSGNTRVAKENVHWTGTYILNEGK